MKTIMILLILLPGMFVSFNSKLFAQGMDAGQPGITTSLAYDPCKNYSVYSGSDLGVNYSKSETILKIWSPPAQEMKLRLYKTSSGNDMMEEISCRKDADGVWKAKLKGDRKNIYYTFQSKIKGKWNDENPDPYARAVGVNGKRGQIVDLNETNPSGWENDQSPVLKNHTDVILYELHIRDLTVAPNSGIKNKGKFLGLTESGTKNSQEQSTGIDHIAEMGVTHVHLLPSFDFCSVDESKLNVPQFNWGYDPQNYNTPEGSYSTDPEDGKVRILEFKKMVQSLHQKGLRVVMDVLYNHTGRTHNSNFDQLVPGYYYREWEKDGKYSNASGCGNETASDRTMYRKFIIESVTYWVREYHVDGFRFDLMAIHDMETMNQVAATLQAIDPSIIVYGEGWTAGDSPLPDKYRALKKNAKKMNGVAVFSDDIRDGIKGSVFDGKSTGFASGNKEMAESVKFGIVAAGVHPQIDYTKVNYSKEPYTKNPDEVINYVSCHDNNTLYDKLKISRPDASEEDITKMDKLANTIVLTSQGIPFLQAGVEMKRTKRGVDNSFNKPDSVNQINWDWKYENRELVDYYKALIALRKAHPAFRMPTNEIVQKNLVFLPTNDPQLIAYQLKDHANKDSWQQILVIFNGSGIDKNFDLPKGIWITVLQNYQFRTEEQPHSVSVTVAPYSTMILYQE
ncbi:MAG: type I pullulanase [Bacteroidales bacterium]|jgi:pullulanase|nr:type I pullulanase [Bacteroidales bacterium]